eukprot:TRINITY_DN9334_c0_g2_i1.p1 TRINITY_DN9334_c0_g2~~TRINITY_DN9334_c0_g2_i1.p1  ORF type:complete len:161 (-),score=40.10 TRINITY_DN9334_c0_g2_i1:214-696(-)
MNIIQYLYEHPLKTLENKNCLAYSSDAAKSSQTSCFKLFHPIFTANENLKDASETCPKLEASFDISLKSSQQKSSEPSLIDKLDAIMESTKRKARKMGPGVKHKRKRKTQEQLKMLSDELAKNPKIGNKRLRDISEETGLSKLQVYKWYWDLKNKKMKTE